MHAHTPVYTAPHRSEHHYPSEHFKSTLPFSAEYGICGGPWHNPRWATQPRLFTLVLYRTNLQLHSTFSYYFSSNITLFCSLLSCSVPCHFIKKLPSPWIVTAKASDLGVNSLHKRQQTSYTRCSSSAVSPLEAPESLSNVPSWSPQPRLEQWPACLSRLD